MALLTETNEQYYAGQQAYVHSAGAGNPQTHSWTADTALVDTTASSYANYKVLVLSLIHI